MLITWAAVLLIGLLLCLMVFLQLKDVPSGTHIMPFEIVGVAMVGTLVSILVSMCAAILGVILGRTWKTVLFAMFLLLFSITPFIFSAFTVRVMVKSRGLIWD